MRAQVYRRPQHIRRSHRLSLGAPTTRRFPSHRHRRAADSPSPALVALSARRAPWPHPCSTADSCAGCVLTACARGVLAARPPSVPLAPDAPAAPEAPPCTLALVPGPCVPRLPGTPSDLFAGQTTPAATHRRTVQVRPRLLRTFITRSRTSRPSSRTSKRTAGWRCDSRTRQSAGVYPRHGAAYRGRTVVAHGTVPQTVPHSRAQDAVSPRSTRPRV